MAARLVAGGLAGKPINDLQDDVDSRNIYLLVTTRNNPQVHPSATTALCCMSLLLERWQSRSAGSHRLANANHLGSLLAAAEVSCFRCMAAGQLGVLQAVCALHKISGGCYSGHCHGLTQPAVCLQGALRGQVIKGGGR